MRERRMLLISAFLLRRITPARAGKTLFDSNLVTFYGDHPRSCGKDSGLQRRAVCRPGSPPLVRERRADWGEEDPNDGITPARAGKTPHLVDWCQRHRDHPRSCGKDFSLKLRLWRFWGSPPLVRERLNTELEVLRRVRITPARAGKTSRLFGALLSAGDHPRSCGKDKSPDAIDMASSGSPPLVRERLVRALGTIDRGGITPARAGKTLYLRCFRFSRRDHPRSCGKDPAARR